MTKKAFTRALSAFMLLMALEGSAQDNERIVVGHNLNIGSGHTLVYDEINGVQGNAVGTQNYLGSPNTLAVGSNDTICTYSASSVALGADNRVQGVSSMGFGCGVKVNSNFGVGLGYNIKANGPSTCMVIGSGIAGPAGANVLLVNNTNNSLAIGFNSTKPTLFVSQSPNNYSQGILDKTGKVAIGDVTPQAKLHIRSDSGEDAGIILVPADTSSNRAFVRIWDRDHHITVGNDKVMNISSGSHNNIGITSKNFKVSNKVLDMGAFGDNKLTFSTEGTPSISSNAYPSNGSYSNSTVGPSYTLEFGNTGLLVRTALYSPTSRPDYIANWRDAMTVSPDGFVKIYGKVGIGDVTPIAKLHIQSERDEDARMIIEAADPAMHGSVIQLQDSQHHISVDTRGKMAVSSSNTFDVASSNFNLDDTRMDLGAAAERKITMVSGNVPALYSNAYPRNDSYYRHTQGSSYALEFGNDGMTLRTAANQESRWSEITNWRTALSVGVDSVVNINGKVGINTRNTTSDYALAVDGGVITTKVYIQDVEDWQDRVFGAGYQLMSLGEVETYVAAHHHLPGIPSEAEVRSEGYDLGAMQAALLGKIEELTLHVIRQQKEIDSLRTLATVRFGYDACGNRVSRALEFAKMEEEPGEAEPDGERRDGATSWQASLRDTFAGCEAMLFPNPTVAGFIVSLTGKDAPRGARATLVTVEGKTLEEREVNGFTEEFDLSGKPAGVYLLRLASEQETKVWKVIKRN